MNKINLLPPEQKEEIRRAKENKKSLRNLYFSLLILIITLLLSLTALFAINLQSKAIITLLAEKEKEITSFGNLEDKAKKLAERLNTIKQINKKTNLWSSVVEEIQKIIPEGVYLTQVKMDSTTKARNLIVGAARGKKEVASLRDAMEKSNKFEYVDIESSKTGINPVTKQEAENFTISFSLSKEALK